MEGSIKRRLSCLLKFLVVNPLSLGNPTQAGASDGSTSSTVAFACVSAIFFITIVSFTAQQSMERTNYSLWILVVILMIAGTIAIGRLLFWTICCHSYDIMRRQRFVDKRTKLEIKFLWLSGLGMLLRSGIILAIQIECVKYFPDIRGILEIISSFLKIFYMLSQISFFTYFRNVRLVGGVLVNYLIGVILLANISIRLSYSMLQLVYNYNFKKNNSSSSMSLANTTTANTPTGEQCFWHSEFYKISNDIRPFLLTASMIFLMLSSKFLIRLWPSVQTRNVYDRNTEQSSERIQPTTSERPTRCVFKSIYIVSFFVGISLNTPFFTMAILMRFMYINNITIVKVFWDIYVIVFLAISIFVILVGMHNLKMNRLQKLSVEMWDAVLLICMASSVITSIVGCTSVLICQVERPITIFTKNILNLFFKFYHTMYITIARRIPTSIPCESGTVLFIHVLMFCSFLGRWFLETFVLSLQGLYILEEEQMCLFPNKESWSILRYFLTPLKPFYDFQSFMFYYDKLW